MTAVSVSRDVCSTLNFISPNSDFNRRYMAPMSEINTGVYEEHQIMIKDARCNPADFTLEKNGFTLVEHKSKVTDFHGLKSDWSGDFRRDDLYGAEMRDVLLQLTGGDKVITFGVVVRQTVPSDTNFQPPASDVHVDWSPRRAHQLAETLLSKSDTPEMKYSHFMCINTWRAISPPPQDYPLAVCDARTLSGTNTVPNTMIGVDKMPEYFTKRKLLPDSPVLSEADLFTYDSRQRWFYFSNMKDDELLVFTLFDSRRPRDGRSAHTAFWDNREDGKPRESVEIRSVVYFATGCN